MLLKLLGIKCTRLTQLGFDFFIASCVWLYLYSLELASDLNFMIACIPYGCLITFGCYAMASIGFELFRLEDCSASERSLQADIVRAKKILASKGYKPPQT